MSSFLHQILFRCIISIFISIFFQDNIQVVCYPVGHAEKLQPFKKSEFRVAAKAWMDFVAERDGNPLSQVCFSKTNSIGYTLYYPGLSSHFSPAPR